MFGLRLDAAPHHMSDIGENKPKLLDVLGLLYPQKPKPATFFGGDGGGLPQKVSHLGYDIIKDIRLECG